MLLYALLRCPQTRQFLGGALTAETANKRVKDLVKNPPENYWILNNEDNNFIGMVGLKHCESLNHYEISYTLLPTYWRQGYASEALHKVMEFVAARFDNCTIIAETQCANLASKALLKKLGFDESHQLYRFNERQIIYSKKIFYSK